jgi:acyl carrier protein
VARRLRRDCCAYRAFNEGKRFMPSTFETVAGIIAATSDIPIEQITPDSHVMKDLEIDSLAFLDITFEIDRRFGIEVPLDRWLEQVNEGKVKSEDYFVLRNLCAQIDSLRAAAA